MSISYLGSVFVLVGLNTAFALTPACAAPPDTAADSVAADDDAVAAAAETEATASATASAISSKCSAQFPVQGGSSRVCVQYNGSQINGVGNVVSTTGIGVDVMVFQCRGIDKDCSLLSPDGVGFVLGHEFVATPLFKAAKGHFYQACEITDTDDFGCSPYLAIPL
jgi:hypothetical protein